MKNRAFYEEIKAFSINIRLLLGNYSINWLNYWVFKASAWLLPWFSACIFRPKTAAEAKRRPLKPYYLAYIGLIIEFIQLIGLYWPILDLFNIGQNN
jgi:hypothetical protein